MRLTVGPLPPAVYWRRRALVLGGLLLVLFLLPRACAGTSGDSADGAASLAGSPTPSVGPTVLTPKTSPPPPALPDDGQPSGDGAETPYPADDAPDGESDDVQAVGRQTPDPDDCTDEEIQVTAEPDRYTFPSGEHVTFTIRIKNVSDRTCNRDVGADRQELYLVKGTGSDKIWSSDDCGAARGSDVREFTPDFEREYYVTWNGRSSASCGGSPEASDGPAPEPGGYQLVGRLGTAYSDRVTITLT